MAAAMPICVQALYKNPRIQAEESFGGRFVTAADLPQPYAQLENIEKQQLDVMTNRDMKLDPQQVKTVVSGITQGLGGAVRVLVGW